MAIIYTSVGRKKKTKPTASQRQLQAEWEALQALHSKPLEKGMQGNRSKLLVHHVTIVMDLKNPPGREVIRHIPSRVTDGGSTAKIAVEKYSGTAMIGIGQMSKSNAVPVFSKEEAIDIAKMRRG